MTKLLIVAAFAASAFGQGTVPALNTWTPLHMGGYPLTQVGYSACRYVTSLLGVVCQPNYLTRGVTSETNDSLTLYQYTTNYLSVLEQGGGPHSLHSFNGGHEVSVTDYYAAADALVFQTDESYGNQWEILSDWWILYGAGLTMRDAPLPTTSAEAGSPLMRVWLGSGQLNEAAINQNDGMMLIFNDFRQGGSAGTGSICQLNLLGMLTTCAATSVTGIPTAGINSGTVRWRPVDGQFYLWGGGNQPTTGTGLTAVTTYCDPTAGGCKSGAIAADTWTTLTTTCTGPDCVGTHPAERQCNSWAYSSQDDKFLMMGGRDLTAGCSSGAAVLFSDTYLFDPVLLAWTELCGPGTGGGGGSVPLCTPAGYSGTFPVTGQNNPNSADSLEYDPVSNVFVFFDSPNATSVTPAVGYAFAISTPLGFGRTTHSYSPASGSLNLTQPVANTTTQAYSFDPSINFCGSVICIAHAETGKPTDSVNQCLAPKATVGTLSSGTLTYVPLLGTPDATCESVYYGISKTATQSHPFVASDGTNLWTATEMHNYAPLGGISASFLLRNAGGTSATWDGGWTAQAPGGTLTASTLATVTLSPFPSGLSTTTTQIFISHGTGTAEVVLLSNVNAGAGTVQFTPLNSHSGAWTIAPAGLIPCNTANCSSTTSFQKIMSFPTGIQSFSAGVLTVSVIEENQNLLPRTHQLYVDQYTVSSGAWTELGGAALDFYASNSHVTYASQPATDGSGNIAICWSEEQETSGTFVKAGLSIAPKMFCSLWNGSSWTISAALNITGSDWAYLPSVAYYSGSWYVAFTESAQNGRTNLYALKCNASWTCSQAGTGPLNINTSTGLAYHPSLTTDGTNLYMAWEEQASSTAHSLGHLMQWSGSSWSVVGSSIAADTTNGSVQDIGIVAASASPGVITAAWVELSVGNLRQVYSQQINASGGCSITTGSTLTRGFLSTSYSTTIATSGCSSPTFGISGQPNGLTINVSTGVISGVPLGYGSYSPVITATGAANLNATLSIGAPTPSFPPIY